VGKLVHIAIFSKYINKHIQERNPMNVTSVVKSSLKHERTHMVEKTPESELLWKKLCTKHSSLDT